MKSVGGPVLSQDHQGGYSGECPCFSETGLLGRLQVSVDLHEPHLVNVSRPGQRVPFRKELFQVAESKVKQRLLVFDFWTGFFYDTATTVAGASSGRAFSFIRWPTPTNTNMCTQRKKNPFTLCQTNTKQAFSNCVFCCFHSSFFLSFTLIWLPALKLSEGIWWAGWTSAVRHVFSPKRPYIFLATHVHLGKLKEGRTEVRVWSLWFFQYFTWDWRNSAW